MNHFHMKWLSIITKKTCKSQSMIISKANLDDNLNNMWKLEQNWQSKSTVEMAYLILIN
jgi:hypothetical protein